MKIYFSILLAFVLVFELKAQNYNTSELTTVHNESSAFLTYDGQRLYFTISNHELNVGGKMDKGDIWFSDLVGNDWSTPTKLNGPQNSKNNDRILGMSEDGTVMYLHGHYERDNKLVKSQGISVSYFNGQNWSFPENIFIPFYKNISEHQSGYITPDGNMLILSAESFNTKGNEDIYVSFYRNNSWTELKNLGTDINTNFQEFTPFISKNSKVLFFSTNGRNGEGSSDVFFSIRKDDTWQSWTEPLNLGQTINTVGKDLNFILLDNLKKVLLINNTSSNGYGNIKITEPVGSIDTLFSPSPPSKLNLQEPITEAENYNIQVKLVSSNGSNLSNGMIFLVEGNLLQEMKNHGNGIYSFSEEIAFDNVLFQAHAPGYIPKEIRHTGENNYRIMLLKAEVGATVKLENVLFEQASTELLNGSERDLNLVVDLMEENPNVIIELSGHTDNRGPASKNVKLSKKRVKAVKNYLVERGIAGRRISGKGYGGEKPIASNDDEETRKLNRRVEFTIVEN